MNDVSETILEQLGGNKFIAMTGAANFVHGDSHLSFKIGKNEKKVNLVKISLNGKDLYDLKFYKVRGLNMAITATVEDVYSDYLAKVFEEHTGLRTSL